MSEGKTSMSKERIRALPFIGWVPLYGPLKHQAFETRDAAIAACRAAGEKGQVDLAEDYAVNADLDALELLPNDARRFLNGTFFDAVERQLRAAGTWDDDWEVEWSFKDYLSDEGASELARRLSGAAVGFLRERGGFNPIWSPTASYVEYCLECNIEDCDHTDNGQDRILAAERAAGRVKRGYP